MSIEWVENDSRMVHEKKDEEILGDIKKAQ